MSSNLDIGPAAEGDLPQIRQLLIELKETVTDSEGFGIEKSIENCRTFLHDPAHFMLAARGDDRVLGFINFTIRKTIMHPRPSGLIDELVVSTGNRKAGIGKRLILETIEKCRELGCCEVEVSTEKSNLGARRFYKACGFEEEAVLLEMQLQAQIRLNK
jgi:ribosomal protein S18 acetylase RimI-like enzyme